MGDAQRRATLCRIPAPAITAVETALGAAGQEARAEEGWLGPYKVRVANSRQIACRATVTLTIMDTSALRAPGVRHNGAGASNCSKALRLSLGLSKAKAGSQLRRRVPLRTSLSEANLDCFYTPRGQARADQVSGGGRFPRLRFDDFRLIHSVQRSHVRAGQDGSRRFGYPGASKS